ncbi:hypothetical protein M422DRAFT_240279 [Sphaerobolus stellatus SS14]|nr:hypothetical protein M422DRAFT_240279 [Sphaerobolus stellatus SS14]
MSCHPLEQTPMGQPPWHHIITLIKFFTLKHKNLMPSNSQFPESWQYSSPITSPLSHSTIITWLVSHLPPAHQPIPPFSPGLCCPSPNHPHPCSHCHMPAYSYDNSSPTVSDADTADLEDQLDVLLADAPPYQPHTPLASPSCLSQSHHTPFTSIPHHLVTPPLSPCPITNPSSSQTASPTPAPHLPTLQLHEVTPLLPPVEIHSVCPSPIISRLSPLHGQHLLQTPQHDHQGTLPPCLRHVGHVPTNPSSQNCTQDPTFLLNQLQLAIPPVSSQAPPPNGPIALENLPSIHRTHIYGMHGHQTSNPEFPRTRSGPPALPL